VATASSPDLARLGYDLSLRALQQQEAALDELRSRTGTLLTGTALVTSFLGARALESDGNTLLAVLGLIAAVACILSSVSVLAPKRNLTFVLDGSAVYEYFTEVQADLVEAQRVLAYWNQEVWNQNQRLIDKLIRLFRVACLALVLTVVLWSSGLALN
jgi:hypothetical protein